MVKNILVPTDFSEQAAYALEVAAQLGKKYKSKIFLLHILDLPDGAADMVGSGQSPIPEAIFFMEQAHKKFEGITKNKAYSKLDLVETVSFEKIHIGIKNACEKNDIDLIIMGSHGSSGFEELFIGSNAEKVVRTTETPVLVVKEDFDIFSVDNIVYATNFDNEDKPCLLAVNDFAKFLGAKLNLVWINTPNTFRTTQSTKDKMNRMIEGLGIENYKLNIYNDINVEKGILNFAASVEAGMIGISTHGRKGLSHFINGSLGEDVVNHAKRPVLTFKIKK